jgi:hypothetical protein
LRSGISLPGKTAQIDNNRLSHHRTTAWLWLMLTSCSLSANLMLKYFKNLLFNVLPFSFFRLTLVSNKHTPMGISN